MKKILGLDLGPNSIGYAITDGASKIEKTGTRVIPMDAAQLSDFGQGNKVSQTAERTQFRLARRMQERHLLRRQRLHRVLSILGFLPPHYANKIDDFGHFIDNSEPKLAWNQGQFLFMDSFEEMLSDFKTNQPDIFKKEHAKIPYDWTIFFLRKKALTQPINKEELAWLLLNFNQKRGYYQLRDESEKENDTKKEEYWALKVTQVEATDQKKADQIWYKVHLENGWIYNRASSIPLDWVGQVKDFIVTTETKKDGNIKRSFRAPGENDWALLKTKTENEIKSSKKTVGHFIYDALLEDHSQKIKGKLVRVIERNFYKEELCKILDKQKEFHPELTDLNLYQAAIEDLYRSNLDYRKSIEGKDFHYLIIENIIFYQRPLKTKKHLISDCKFESYTNKDRTYKLKSMPKSHPLYQEFRLWKFIAQLKIFYKDIDVTKQLICNDQQYVELFNWLNNHKEIDNKGFIKYPGFAIPKAEQEYYRWNYVVEDNKKYPCNETLSAINNRLKKHALPSIANELQVVLWHLLYSVRDKYEIQKALTKFARKHHYEPTQFVAALKGCVFENEYGAYSEKAIKKLLSLMRRGSYWSADAIDKKTKNRIDNIINGVFDEQINDKLRENCSGLTHIGFFQGLEEWLASYIIYGRHSESADTAQWTDPKDIDLYLANFKQHSMRNPIVEQVVVETLRLVRDLWLQYGKVDEIHIELAREMKKTKDERVRDTKRITENENTNYRIRRILEEFQCEDYGIENVRSYSASHQDIFKIYEEFALSQSDIPDEIATIVKSFNERDAKKQPTKGQIIRYKLWLEQQYRSPYTGEMIPLAKLFTPAYEIEHIIPQSLYTDNTLSNKVICESEVNKLKGNQLGMKFIKENQGRKVTLSGGKTVTVFTEEQYTRFVDTYYSKNVRKAKNLRSEELPEAFTNSQLNNTRYISRFISGLLSNIVRQEGETESISKHIILTNGNITDALKKDWGLNDSWNDLVSSRFERLNQITQTTHFGESVCQQGKRFFRTRIPLELSKGFSKKRIDHRHHALDAIVIACTTRAHINYLNNVSSKENERDLSRYQLRNNLCYKHKPDPNGPYEWRFAKPWDSFTQDTHSALKEVIVSFKQNLRVINKATNKYQRFADGKKYIETQKGTHWAIRKSLHKETVFGIIKKVVTTTEAIKKIDSIADKQLRSAVTEWIEKGYTSKKIASLLQEKSINRVAIYSMSASRKAISTDFDHKKIETITDSGIQKILLNHLGKFDHDPKRAFTPNEIERMNQNITDLNNGRPHKPIQKVRIGESVGNKFAVGTQGNKSKKYVEADKGTNLFFAIYEDRDTKSIDYESIPLNLVIENQKNALSSVPPINGKGFNLKYVLSPNDLVYVPTQDQLGRPLSAEEIDKQRIYKMVSCTKKECHFIPHHIANRIVDKLELGTNNKSERAWSGEMIKSICIPIKVDRLGHIIRIEQ